MKSEITPTLLCQLADAPLSKKPSEELGQKVLDCSDPAQLYKQAQIHGLTPLVHVALEQLNVTNNLPSKITQKFHKKYYTTLADNMKKMHALDILRQNLPAQIPLLILKGPALIHRIYHNPALRPMSDIDLLIQPSHLNALKDCLRTLAYTSPTPYPDIYTKDNVTFDIHTDPLHADRISHRLKAVPLNLDHLWQNATPIATSNNLLMLCLTDQILTLSVHALKHGYERNIWLFDILYSLKQACQNNLWEHVEKDCAKHNFGPILSFTLHAIQTHLGLDLPEPAQKLQKSFPIGRIRRKILYASPRSGNFQILEPLVMSDQCPKRIDRLKFLISFAFPKRTVLTQISGLSGRWHWLSYPYRIVQLVGLGTVQIARLIYRLTGTRLP